MKHETTFLMRCFAMFLAVLMALTGSNVGVALQAFAAESDGVTVSVGKLVADNYELTAEEEALLASGCLTGGTITYTVPTDGAEYVTVDTDNKKITAESVDGWVPTIARIVVGTDVKESIALDGGVGTYTYDENAFSVQVDYILNQSVDAELQENLLKAPALLKNGLANMKAAYDGSDTNLGTVVLAIDTLKKMANGITMSFGENGSMTVQFGVDARNAVSALSQQLTANGNLLNLQVTNAAYANAASKVQFLAKNGATYKAHVEQTYNALLAIKNDPLANNNILDAYLQSTDPTSYTSWMAFKNILANLVAALEPVVNADWSVLDTDVLKDGITDAEYAALDVLAAALGETTAMPEIKDTLHVADTTLNINLSMYNVNVVVELLVVENVVDSANLVTFDSNTATVVVAEDASADEILAEVAANGIEADSLTEWAGVYADGHFNVDKSELPASLNEDITYTIAYAPKDYTVTLSYADDMVVPYGYQLTLPIHEIAEQAYDYTVNGVSYAQGAVITIEGDTNISRSSGKAYATTDLYKVIAENYGNDVAYAILTSGALKNNVTISVRKPDPADAAALLTLLGGVVTADNYDAAYNGLLWNPNTYGVEGTENTFSGNTASWSGKSVKVQYVLKLTNFSVEEVAAVLELAKTLKSEAAAQKATLDAFAGNKDAMGQLDKAKLGALNGVIDVTDFSADPAKNEELRTYFKGLVSGIIANNLDANNKLKIYNMLGEYEAEGLKYYYENYAAFIAEIESLAGYLGGMLADEEKVDALKIMVGAAGFPEYADKIVDLEAKLAQVLADLSEPNEAIDLTSANLSKLMTALSVEGDVVTAEAGYAYLLSETLTALDESQVMVQVIIETPKGNATVTSAEMDRGIVLTQAVIDELKAKVNDKVAELLGADNVKFYTAAIEGTALDALVGTELNTNVNTYYTYAPTVYYVSIDGEDDQTVTIEDLEINLPKHPTAGWKYEYTVDGISGITTSTYTFTAEQLTRLFNDGIYEITRVEINEAAEKLEETFADWAVRDENGNIIALNAKIDADKNGVMSFVETIMMAGYSYIGLNGEGLVYMNEEDTTEICLQTLINAILNDNDFGSQTLIDLGTNGQGKLVSTQMQLGNSADDCITVPFTLTLNSVPSQMATVAKGLNAVKNYMSFQSDNGKLDIKLSLPEKVYEVYLTALLATGNVSKDDITAVNDEIAFMFLYDYLDIITKTDATTTSYTNTLHKLGINKSLEGYEDYYQMLKKALSADGLVVNSAEGDGIFDISATAAGKKAIDGLVGLLGVDISAYETYLGMLKEYKEGNSISVTVVPSLTNAGTPFDAVLIDVNAIQEGVGAMNVSVNGVTDLIKGEGVANGYDFTTDLIARAAEIKGEAAIMLLGDVTGNLVFNDVTILDLNGYTIDGSITSNGTLVIVDSSMQTDCGWITGSVTGNVKIIAGNYNADVSAYLGSGYKQVGTTVQHALFVVEADENGDLTYVLNTDAINKDDLSVSYAKHLAVDIAVDVALNFFTAAALSVDGNYIYHIDLDDMIGFLDSTSKVDELINWGLQCIDAPGLSGLVNMIMADLLDFAAIEEAVANNEAVATYTLTTAPWAVAVEHETTEDYITFGITYNTKLARSTKMSLKFAGDNKAYVEKLAGALADIVVAEGTFVTVDLEQPTYADKTLSVAGSAIASAEVDLTGDRNYVTVLTIIMAYGNPEQADALVEAINVGNHAKVKDIIDEMTVEDVFDALKAMNRATSLTEMAEQLGVSKNVAAAEKLEAIYHLFLCGAGKALEVLEITGRDSKLGNLDKDNDGTYEFTATAKRKGDVSARGYAVNYEITEVTVSFTLHLFGGDCMVGDVNHDGKIDIYDLMELRLILANPGTYDIICEYCADVEADGVIDIYDLMKLRLILAWNEE